MAHNINEENGKHSFFSVNEKAWHGLGQIVEQYPTSAEAIQYAGLDYLVEKRPLFTNSLDNELAGIDTGIAIPKIEVPGFYATVRTDNNNVLGVVGKDYEVVQNVNAFEFFDAIVDGGEGILYETAGALGKGERIFITAKLPGYIRVGKQDLIEMLNISPNTLQSLRVSGKLKFTKIGSIFFYKQEEIKRMFEGK
jgi:hypothetical protein